jgi:hypothetical protein
VARIGPAIFVLPLGHTAIAQLLLALQYLTILFFVAGAVPFVFGRRYLRRLALLAYGCAVLLAIAWVAVWLAKASP